MPRPVASFRFPPRLLPAALACVALTFLAACPRRVEPPDMPPKPPPQFLGPGESAVAEFPADGQWHASGFAARAGALIKFEPLGEAAQLSDTALLVHIGRSMTMRVTKRSPMRVTRPGEIFFRADPRGMGPYSEKTVQVRILNQRKE